MVRTLNALSDTSLATLSELHSQHIKHCNGQEQSPKLDSFKQFKTSLLQKSEVWQYSPLNKLQLERFQPAMLKPVQSKLPAYEIQFNNGVPNLNLDLGPIEFGLIANMPKVLSDKLRARPYNSLSYLQQSFSQDGLYLHIPDNHNQDLELKISYLSNLADAALYPSLIIIVGENNQVKLNESFEHGSTDLCSQHSMCQLILLPKSSLVHTICFAPTEACRYLSHLQVQVQKAANYQLMSFNQAMPASWQQILVHLEEPEAKAHISVLELGYQHKKNDCQVEVHHHAAMCSSTIAAQAVLFDQATSVFSGKINVASHAGQTEAHLNNRNLLLSDEARLYTKPLLEIYHDDVQCSHGSSVGDLNREAIFYLQARGLAKDQARELLIHAFVAPLLAKLPLSVTQDLNLIPNHLETA